MPAIESTKAATRWTTRIVPVFLTAAVAYATYVVVARVCVDYLLRSLNENGTATAILVIYFVFLLLMVGTYARTLYNANFDPGVVPLGPRATQRAKDGNQMRRYYGADDIEGRAYESGPDNNPDSPGLETFYSRDAFVYRVHHSREIGRCVYRMDHYCPWAGGMIGEKSFKFFVQFTTYASLFCAVVLGANAYALRRQAGQGVSPDSFFLAAIVIAAFFGLFAFLMTVTSARSRDDLATRTFAILETGPGENPWDLGPWRNWQSVMGTSPFDWFLPIHHSPCSNHESLESLYSMDRILNQLRDRYGLPAGPPSDESTAMEMRGLRSQ
ncbi:hypothetical protein EKO27_g8744 [Xylaria grammica]|uniref:Palmitoyltransferase n=1 Tax=Xylaria grammica TaxID=363999 RepID=A0A439CW76_9PEZI|nr:hypothetical protein EKO27_g8744 [Xylaria grammica]